MKTTKIKLERGSVISLVSWLKQQPLAGLKSRSRTRFLQVIYSVIREFDSFRMKGVDKYANRDEKTKEVVIIEDAYNERMEYEFTPENRKAFEEEVATYLKEVVEIELEPKLREDYGFVKGLVLNTQVEFKGVQAEEYDKWCSALETEETNENS